MSWGSVGGAKEGTRDFHGKNLLKEPKTPRFWENHRVMVNQQKHCCERFESRKVGEENLILESYCQHHIAVSVFFVGLLISVLMLQGCDLYIHTIYIYTYVWKIHCRGQLKNRDPCSKEVKKTGPQAVWQFHVGIASQTMLGGGLKYFLFFTPTWGNDPIWLVFFRWLETTNQNVLDPIYWSCLKKTVLHEPFLTEHVDIQCAICLL